MKKLLGVMLAAALVLSVAGSASAHTWWPMPSNDVKVENEWTKVKTTAVTSINTGSNVQTGGLWSSPKLTTGGVVNVGTTALSQVNMTMLPSCNCSRGDVKVENQWTKVSTGATTSINTGSNVQTAMFSMPTVTTGGVNTIGTSATSDVNWTQFGVSQSE